MTASTLFDPDVVYGLREAGQQLRVDAVRCSSAAGSGHPTSSLSAADLMAVLLARRLHYDFDDPRAPGNDHLIFSKGHASPLYYAMLKAVGAITDEELLTYRSAGSRLEGHPTPRLPWVDVATGSLGQGLPIGVGLAIAGRDLDQLPYRTWVLCGDSELRQVTIVAAGVTVHEALAAASELAAGGISARVIDAYSVKPIDAATLRQAARETGRLLTVEDHYPEGGLGDAVLDALAAGGPLAMVRKLAVRELPGSATPAEQLALAGIDSAAIVSAAADLVAGRAS